MTPARQIAPNLLFSMPDLLCQKLSRVEVARSEGREARLIEQAADIDPGWLANVSTVGVTAGASAPEELVREAVRRLQALGFADGGELVTAEEHVSFPPPRELR